MSFLAFDPKHDSPIPGIGRIKFKPNNIAYGQDFSFYRGIPTDVWFSIRRSSEKQIVLEAPGYGGEPYGNGCLYISVRTVSRSVSADPD